MKKIEIKYLKALQDLRETLREPEDMSLTEFLKDRKIPATVGKLLVDNRIIDRVSAKDDCVGRCYQYHWISIEPNINMTRTLLDRYRKLTRGERKDKVDERSFFEVVQETTESSQSEAMTKQIEDIKNQILKTARAGKTEVETPSLIESAKDWFKEQGFAIRKVTGQNNLKISW